VEAAAARLTLVPAHAPVRRLARCPAGARLPPPRSPPRRPPAARRRRRWPLPGTAATRQHNTAPAALCALPAAPGRSPASCRWRLGGRRPTPTRTGRQKDSPGITAPRAGALPAARVPRVYTLPPATPALAAPPLPAHTRSACAQHTSPNLTSCCPLICWPLTAPGPQRDHPAPHPTRPQARRCLARSSRRGSIWPCHCSVLSSNGCAVELRMWHCTGSGAGSKGPQTRDACTPWPSRACHHAHVWSGKPERWLRRTCSLLCSFSLRPTTGLLKLHL
jgi:hypothetical protein